MASNRDTMKTVHVYVHLHACIFVSEEREGGKDEKN